MKPKHDGDDRGTGGRGGGGGGGGGGEVDGGKICVDRRVECKNADQIRLQHGHDQHAAIALL